MCLRRCVISTFDTVFTGDGAAAAIEIRETLVVNCVHGVELRRRARAAVRDCVFKARTLVSRDRRAEAINVGVDELDKAGQHGARAQLERVSVQACGRSALTVCAGSALSATLCLLEGPATMLLAVCSHGGGCATLAYCIGRRAGHCLFADYPRAHLRVCGGRFEGSLAACSAQRGAVLAATDATFRGRREPVPEQKGISDRPREGVVRVQTGSRGWLRGCHIRDGYIGLSNPNGDVRMVDVTISDVRGTLQYPSGHHGGCDESSEYAGAGVYCVGGRLTWSGGAVERCIMGVEVRNDGRFGSACRVQLDGVVLRDCVTGVHAMDACEVKVSRCEFLGPQRERVGEAAVDLRNKRKPWDDSAGVVFGDGSCGCLRDCVLEGWCMCATVVDAAVEFEKCEFTVSVPRGSALNACGTVTALECGFGGLAQTAGARSGDRLGVLCTAGECVIQQCRFLGITDAAMNVGSFGKGRVNLTVEDTLVGGGQEPGGPRCKAGLVMAGDVRVVVRNCSVEGTQHGAVVDGGTLTASQLRIKDVDQGLSVECVDGTASAELVDTEISGRVFGLFAKGPQTQVKVLRGAFTCGDDILDHRSDSTAAEFHGGAVGSMEFCQLSKAYLGLEIGECEEELGEQCSECGLSGKAARDAAELALICSGGRGLQGAQCVHTGAVSRVAMENVCVRDVSWGVRVHRYGLLEASGVSAVDCGVGFHLVDGTAPHTMHDCISVDCTCGEGVVRPPQQYTYCTADDLPLKDITDVSSSGCDQKAIGTGG